MDASGVYVLDASAIEAHLEARRTGDAAAQGTSAASVADIQALVDWQKNPRESQNEIQYRPARVLLQADPWWFAFTLALVAVDRVAMAWRCGLS